MDTSYLIPAVVRQESRGDPNAVSPKGAAGIMQIMPDTARDPGYGVRPLQGWDGVDPRTAPVEEQMRFGSEYLQAMSNHFGGDTRLALAAYNAGPGVVEQHGGVPNYPETQNYVNKIAGGAQVADNWQSRAEPVSSGVQATPISYSAPTSDWKSRAEPLKLEAKASDWRTRAQAVEAPKQVGTDQGTVAAGLQGFNSAVPFGERIVAGIGAVGATGLDKVLGTEGTSIASNYDQIRADQDATRKDHPIAYGVGAVGGIANSLAVGGVGTSAAKAAATGRGFDAVPKALSATGNFVKGGEVAKDASNLVKAGHVAAQAGRGAVVGGASGAAYGYGASDHRLDSKEAAQDAVNTGGLSAAVGFAAPLAGAALKLAKGNPEIGKMAQALNDKAGEAFKQAEELGARFNPAEVANPFRKALAEVKPKPIAGKVMTTEDKELLSHLKEYDDIAGSPLTLADVERLDKGLTQKINKFVDRQTGQVDNTGRQLTILQTKLRSIVDAVPENAGNDALVNGRKLWRAKMMVNDLDSVAERAALTKDPGSSARVGYRNLFLDKDRVRGWPKEALDLLEKAATPTWHGDILDLVSSRLPAIIMGSTGNLGGAATQHLVGMAGQGIKAGLAAKQGARVQESIVKGTMEGLREIKPKSDVPQQLLASPGKLSKLPMSDKEVNISRKLMEQPGAGPDLSGASAQPLPSRVRQVQEGASPVKSKQFGSLAEQLRGGQISQNAFIKVAKTKFKLTETKARQLAKEVQKYGVNK